MSVQRIMCDAFRHFQSRHSSAHPFIVSAGTLPQRNMSQQELQLKTVKPSSSYAKSNVAKPYPASSSSKSSGAGSHSSSASASTGARVAPELPLYSYKDYTPSPAVVYIRHEDEANELVQSLSGYGYRTLPNACSDQHPQYGALRLKQSLRVRHGVGHHMEEGGLLRPTDSRGTALRQAYDPGHSIERDVAYVTRLPTNSFVSLAVQGFRRTSRYSRARHSQDSLLSHSAGRH